jgi:uncharacterized protein (TIGR03435 family)
VERFMKIWRLLVFLIVAVGGGFGQAGFYGPVTVHLKAGDAAPDISFTRMLGAPGAASWSQTNLTGKMTVLAFYPDTSHNPQIVTAWNELVDKFAGKPVQFVWVTGEKEVTLLPALEKTPVKGWVFYDPEGKTGAAYGLDMPVGVLIGADRKILGFDSGVSPNESMVNAALAGRTTTTRPEMANMQAFVESGAVLLQAQPRAMPRFATFKPKIEPSETLHVSVSKGDGRGSFGGDDFISLQGFDLREAIRAVYKDTPVRVRLPAALDNDKRYDFALVLPEPVGRGRLEEDFRKGLEAYFHVTARRENRLVDVYVVTATPNKRPLVVEATNGFGGGVSGGSYELEAVSGADDMNGKMMPQKIEAVRSVSIDGTVDSFCEMLEEGLNRPVVNETHLQGEFKFDVKSSGKATNDFLERLREETGLVITAGQRNVEMLVVE